MDGISYLFDRLLNWAENFRDVICRMNRPGYLNFDYQVRFYKPNIDTDIGVELKKYKTVSDVRRDHNYANPDSTLSYGTPPTALGLAPAEAIFRNMIKTPNSSPVLYTDGSKLANEETGYSVFCEDPAINRRVRANQLITIFEAEAMAIAETILAIESFGLRSATIASDSLSVLSGLGAPDVRGLQHPLLYLIRNLLLKLEEHGTTVSLIWVPSHAGISGNEMADLLAYEAASTGDANQQDRPPESMDRALPSNFFNRIKQDFLEESTAFFTETAAEKGSRYFNRVKMKPGIPWFHALGLSANVITLISRLRSFHTCTNAHLTDKNILSDASCECGEEIQDADHLFFRCPLHKPHSDRLILDLRKDAVDHGTDAASVAFSENVAAYRALARFISDTGVRI